MARLIRFDVIEHRSALLVVVESDLLPDDASVVVIPLIARYPIVRHLNPVIELDGHKLVLATRLIGPVLRAPTRGVGNVAEQGEKITRAVDVLMSGI